ncbi:MAG: sigma-E processing peptidase SpoIIGA [Oscillospiraceae bacterium]
MVIYIDVLIIANFIIGYFLLLATAILSGYTYKRKRIICAALIGAFSSLIIFWNIKSVLLGASIKIFILACCVMMAFGYKSIKKFAIQAAYYIFFNMLLTGMVVYAAQKTSVIYQNNTFFYFNISPITLVVFSLIIYGTITLCQLVKERILPRETMEISLCLERGTDIKLKAFFDTGFALKDIINNKDIILVDYNAVKNYISQDLQEMINDYFSQGISKANEKITPVFFNTISGDGNLPGIKAVSLKIKDREISSVMVAFSKLKLSENVEAIFGNDIQKQL